MCSRTEPASRAVRRLVSGVKARTMTKCRMVTTTASLTRPAAAAMPIAAHSQIAAAVVSPCTAPCRVMIRPAPRKPMPGDDLGRDPGGVDLDRARAQHVEEAVLADDQDQGGCRADDRLGAQAGALAVDLAFQADQRGQAEGDQQFDDLPAALSGTAEQWRIGQPGLHADTVARAVAEVSDHREPIGGLAPARRPAPVHDGDRGAAPRSRPCSPAGVRGVLGAPQRASSGLFRWSARTVV